MIGSYGDESWRNLALNGALPSTEGQGLHEVIVSHLEDGTLAESRNEGAAQATGKWILFLDADDQLEPGFMDAMRSAMRGAKASTLFTPAARYVRPGRSQPHTRVWPRMDIRDGNWLIIGTIISRKMFKEVGGFREYGWSEDWALFAEAINRGGEVIEVPEAIYRANVNLKSRNRSKHHKEMLYWHACIGHDLWPEVYDAPTPTEHRIQKLMTPHVRRLDR